jgi:leader peptidase (prepilin peptidase)/N-methyltransferase
VTLELFTTLVAGLVGAMLGSFLNVCILRWPRDESVVRPRSRCPGCHELIVWYDNIPVVSWLLLRGRCRRCQTAISAQYPLVECATALLWAWMGWRYGPTAEAVRFAVFATLLLGIAMTDARDFIIPHEFTFGGLAVGLALAFVVAPAGLAGAVFGACVGAGLLYFVGLLGRLVLRREAMGGGDVAMLAMVGGYLGWEAVLATVFLGAVVGLVLELALRSRRAPAPPAPVAAPADPTPADPTPADPTIVPADLPPGVAASEPSRRRDLALLGVVLAGVVPASLLWSGTLWSALGGMLAGLGLGFICFTVASFFLRPVPLVEGWYHYGFGVSAVFLPLLAAAGWSTGQAVLVVASLLVGGTVVLHLVARGVRADAAPPAPDPLETMTTAELRQLQYLPFGVSLAIAAGLVAFVLGPDRVTAWLSIYR